MMRSITFAFAIAAAIIVGSSILLRSRSPAIATPTATMPSLQELHRMAGVDKLPVQQIEDRSLVFLTGEENE